jgi:hypothetical protein
MKALFLLSFPLLIGCAAAPVPGATDRPVAAAPGGDAAPSAIAPASAAPVASAPPAASAPAAPDASQKPAATPTPLPKGTVVLHVGSSSAGALGVDLKAELEKRGIKNVLKYEESTYIPQWASPRLGLARLVATHKPDLVLINVGGNEVAMPDPSVRADAIRRVVKAVGDRPCLWIGAPRWKGVPHTGIREVIQQNCAPCRYVDTDALVPHMKPTADGAHPTIPERHRWARRMIEWMMVNRDPNDKRPWSFKKDLEMPPPEP